MEVNNMAAEFDGTIKRGPFAGMLPTQDYNVVHVPVTFKVITKEYDEDDDTYHVILAADFHDDGTPMDGGSRLDIPGVPPGSAEQFEVGQTWDMDGVLSIAGVL